METLLKSGSEFKVQSPFAFLIPYWMFLIPLEK